MTGSGSGSGTYVAVVGPGHDVSPALLAQAREVGRLLAARGAVVLSGGLGGVMEAASRGAYEAGGITVGLLPGPDRSEANPYLTVALPTGLGEMRNALLVRSGDAVIAVGCSWLSEVALAVRTGVPIVAIECWDLPEDGPLRVGGAAQAVAAVLGD
ncbi:TIGR00725 family protein [Raineyella fluvialis]|uniref:TIGR00725 family protein n=1 Tax=Raineyella fluvialis TaxID=2662261 RepID=A0A5Q2F7F6_9ACTN|nr:TIGR00725 family protein [Raineyella fluvialis]QGF22588.1 TIGR00725 family protein [Raineyella fluvialis]